jgi:hypothetical protein
MATQHWLPMRLLIVTFYSFLLSSPTNSVSLVMFLGINDCGTTECDELDSIVEKIFDTLHHLHVKARARNFVLIDVPPIDRSPQGIISHSTHMGPPSNLMFRFVAIDSEAAEEIEERIKTWNDLLQQHATEFGLTHEDGTVLLFSSHRLLMDVLDDPLEYDFTEGDVTTEGGGIWADDLHLRSEVHEILAEQLLKALDIHLKGPETDL